MEELAHGPYERRLCRHGVQLRKVLGLSKSGWSQDQNPRAAYNPDSEKRSRFTRSHRTCVFLIVSPARRCQPHLDGRPKPAPARRQQSDVKRLRVPRATLRDPGSQARCLGTFGLLRSCRRLPRTSREEVSPFSKPRGGGPLAGADEGDRPVEGVRGMNRSRLERSERNTARARRESRFGRCC